MEGGLRGMTVEVAFIGAGGIAKYKHFDNLEANPNAEITAICDIDEATAREAADRFAVDAYTDYTTLYDEATFDAVFICIPPFAHDGQELMAIDRGIDLFIEKPLALSVQYAESVRDALADTDVIAQVGYNWRYSEGVQRARELLGNRSIGFIDGYWWGGVPDDGEGWWSQYDKSGGQTVEQVTHIFDTVRYLAGDVTRVSAAGSHQLEDRIDFADCTSATLEHTDGSISHVSSSCASESGKTGLEVVADGATLEISPNSVYGRIDGEEIEETFEGDAHGNGVDRFIEAVSTRDPSIVRSPYADGTETLRLTLAVNESIESGEPVDLL